MRLSCAIALKGRMMSPVTLHRTAKVLPAFAAAIQYHLACI
jgi:hypothetical protein